mmetsp:Transcript_28906/g.53111  ORF Transcript_28906/g.53111 Transcript_28906/m.53111 type:complete len:558 (-) Transcript_28906:360-2033(-)
MDSETAIKLCFEKSGVRRSCVASAIWPNGLIPTRLPEALLKIFPNDFSTITGCKNACRRGEILVDGKKGRTSDIINGGELLTWALKSGDPTFSTMPLDPDRLNNNSTLLDKPLNAYNTPLTLQSSDLLEVVNDLDDADLDLGLEVVYEDDHMGVVIKPQGLPTQGKGGRSAQGLLLARMPSNKRQKTNDKLHHSSPSDHKIESPRRGLTPSNLPGRMAKPTTAHRLDAPTGGLLLCGKTKAAVASLCGLMRQRCVTKRYSALLKGRLDGSGFVSLPLRGQPSVSRFEAIKSYNSFTFGTLTLVSLWPLTGRYHQLRKHCAFLGRPILGDERYRIAHESWLKDAALTADGYITPYEIHCDKNGASSASEGQNNCQKENEQQRFLSFRSEQEVCEYGHQLLLRLGVVEIENEDYNESEGINKSQVQNIAIKKDETNLIKPEKLSDHDRKRKDEKTHNGQETIVEDSTDIDVDGVCTVLHVAGSENKEEQAPKLGVSALRHLSNTDTLLDGSKSPLCLWAVQLKLQHPVLTEVRLLNFDIQHHADRVYKKILKIETKNTL